MGLLGWVLMKRRGLYCSRRKGPARLSGRLMVEHYCKTLLQDVIHILSSRKIDVLILAGKECEEICCILVER